MHIFSIGLASDELWPGGQVCPLSSPVVRQPLLYLHIRYFKIRVSKRSREVSWWPRDVSKRSREASWWPRDVSKRAREVRKRSREASKRLR